MRRDHMRRIAVLVAVAITLAIGSASAQDPVKVHPNNFKVVFENAQVRVLRVTMAPHEKLESHEVRDGVAVPLTDYEVVMQSKDGTAKVLTRKTGDPEWVPAGNRTVESSNNKVEAILIELKSAPAAPETK
jgi:hypothetical protein